MINLHKKSNSLFWVAAVDKRILRICVIGFVFISLDSVTSCAKVYEVYIIQSLLNSAIIID